MTHYSGLRGCCRATQAAGRAAAIALGVSIPLSVALDNLLLAVVLLAWLLGGGWRDKFVLAASNRVYLAALLLFAALLAGTFYSKSAPDEAALFLKKYLDLALIPVLGFTFLEARTRMRGLQALAGGLALVLLTSCALKAGWLPVPTWLNGTAASPVVFKLRLTHNILMAFAAFLYVWLAWSAATTQGKILWGALALLAVANVTLMVDGATGYAVLTVLALLFGWQRARWRGVAAVLLFAAAVVATLSVAPGPFRERVQNILSEARQARPDRPASTSTGYRLEFYRNTLTLVRNHPLVGTGTGSFSASYADLVRGSGQIATDNPHNEFLLITVQTGLVGLAALLWLLWQQWRLAPQLPTPLERGLAQGLVVMMITVCLFNSALLDHTEGLLYAWLTALLYAGLKSDLSNR